jgi:hypothetical protein
VEQSVKVQLLPSPPIYTAVAKRQSGCFKRSNFESSNLSSSTNFMRERKEIESQYKRVHDVGEDDKYAFDKAIRQEVVHDINLEVFLDIRDLLSSIKDKLDYGLGIYNA